MKRKLDIVIRFPREIDMAPTSQSLNDAFRDILKKFVGDVGTAQSNLSIIEHHVNTDTKTLLNVAVELETDSKTALKNIMAALSGLRAMEDASVSTSIIRVSPDLS